jgi:hypothetical protein
MKVEWLLTRLRTKELRAGWFDVDYEVWAPLDAQGGIGMPEQGLARNEALAFVANAHHVWMAVKVQGSGDGRGDKLLWGGGGDGGGEKPKTSSSKM